jgi:hypothetical protein
MNGIRKMNWNNFSASILVPELIISQIRVICSSTLVSGTSPVYLKNLSAYKRSLINKGNADNE